MSRHGCPLAYGPNDEGRCYLCGAQLPPRRRRYCSGEHARLYTENHHWGPAHERALVLAGGMCTAEGCTASEWDADVVLEVHHLDDRVRGRARYAHGCHNHQDRLAVLCDGHHLNETRWELSKGRPVQLALAIPRRELARA